MFILALDIATQVGWASGRPGDQPTWGSRTFEGEHTGAVVSMWRHWLNARCYEMHPGLICFEAPYVPHAGSKVPMNAKTLRRLLGMCATAEAVAWELRIPCREATTLEISRFFIGTQRLARGEKKQKTIETCLRYGWDVSNDNEADAVALWHYAEFICAPEIAARRGGGGPLLLPNAPGAFVRKDAEAMPPALPCRLRAEGSSDPAGRGGGPITRAARGYPDEAGKAPGPPANPKKRTPPVVPDRAALLFPPPAPGETSDGSPA